LESRFGPSESLGGSLESRLGSSESLGGPLESRLGPPESLGGSLESRLGSSESLGGPLENRFGPLESLGGSLENRFGPPECLGGPLESRLGPPESLGGPLESRLVLRSFEIWRKCPFPGLRRGAYLRFMDPATRHSHMGTHRTDLTRGQAPRLRVAPRDSAKTTIFVSAQICAQTTWKRTPKRSKPGVMPGSESGIPLKFAHKRHDHKNGLCTPPGGMMKID
jgi:hypothetical protein